MATTVNHVPQKKGRPLCRDLQRIGSIAVLGYLNGWGMHRWMQCRCWFQLVVDTRCMTIWRLRKFHRVEVKELRFPCAKGRLIANKREGRTQPTYSLRWMDGKCWSKKSAPQGRGYQYRIRKSPPLGIDVQGWLRVQFSYGMNQLNIQVTWKWTIPPFIDNTNLKLIHEYNSISYKRKKVGWRI